MILELGDGSSALARGAAAIVLALHVGAGLIGVASGMVALFARKGSTVHRQAGIGFVVAMLVMAGVGAAVSPFLPIPNWANVVAGVFTWYLVLTSWMTVRHRAAGAGRFAAGAVVIALGVAAADAFLGMQAAANPAGSPDGTPVPAYFIFSAAAALAAIGDLQLSWRGGLSGPVRIARHFWRMCLALFIASSSFFLGQQQVFPAALRGSLLLAVPEIAVLGAMLYWLTRLPLAHWWRRRASTASGA